MSRPAFFTAVFTATPRRRCQASRFPAPHGYPQHGGHALTSSARSGFATWN